MATSDARSGFRLPWSSDRTHDNEQSDVRDEAVDSVLQAAGPDVPADDSAPVSTGIDDQPSETGPVARRTEPIPATAAVPEEPKAMVDTVSATTSASESIHRRPSKLMADLAAAMRTTAETAREQALSQLDADATQIVETIRTRSTESAADLRARSDEDIAGIREWSKAEIARIREETDQRISERKTQLESEVAEHAASVEQRIEDVQRTVAAYQAEMADFFERLLLEDDPARLATMAETMPEPPSLEAWADLEAPAPEVATYVAPTPTPATSATADAAAAGDTWGAQDDAYAGWADRAADPTDAAPETPAEAEAKGEAEAEAEATMVAEVAVDTWPEAVTTAETPAALEAAPQTEAVEAVQADVDSGIEADAEVSGAIEPDASTGAESGTHDADSTDPADAGASHGWPAATYRPSVDPWGPNDEVWTGRNGAATSAETGTDKASADGWGAAEPALPDVHGDDTDTVDRGAVMAALEATAEGIAAAEAAAARFAEEATAEAEPAGSGWGTAETATDPTPAAGGWDQQDGDGDQSFVDRIASLIPHRDVVDEADLEHTQVVVTGLVSVASIASFKRHLSRLPGVQSVAVASGPQGEFVFNASHAADVSFRDVLPSMPGFGARVTGTSDGIVNVAAHDPEAEG